MNPSAYIAGFDSASAMLRATASFLRGRDFPVLGSVPRVLVPVMRPVAAVNLLPERAKESVYVWSGANEAIRPSKLGGVRAEVISRWATGSYPNRRYQAVAIGASNGVLVRFYAALGIPWLPQTILTSPCAGTACTPMSPKTTWSGERNTSPRSSRRTPTWRFTTCTTPTRTGS